MMKQMILMIIMKEKVKMNWIERVMMTLKETNGINQILKLPLLIELINLVVKIDNRKVEIKVDPKVQRRLMKGI